MKTRQLRIRFPDLEQEERKDKGIFVLMILGALGLTAVTVLPFLGIIPFWAFPIPFAATLVIVIIVSARKRS